MQRFLKIPYIAILVVILVGGVGAWWWHARSDTRMSFRTAVVKRGDLVATINATGTIEPVEVVDVGAQVAGLIRSFGKDKDGKQIDYGSTVEEGTVLAQIDDSVYAADVALARAQLEQEKAKLAQAEADWKRTQELVNSQLLPLTAYDSNKASYEVAKANVDIAEATLSKAQRNLDFCVIKSPVRGVIIDRRVNIGQTVVSSLNAPSLFLIAKDLTKMQIWAAVNEADIGRIVPGAPVTFTCDAFPGKEFTGAVGKVRLNATMTQNVVMYTVEVNTENPENILLPYLTANVHFVVHTESNTLSVPNAALRWSPSSPAEVAPTARAWKPADQNERAGVVWVKEGEFVRPVEVKLGASDGVNTAILSGNVREEQEVVTGESADKSPAVTKNPFIPQLRRR
jgi:HlyD family secretion protein